MCAGRKDDGWGVEVVGEKEVKEMDNGVVDGGAGVNVLGVRRKRDRDGERNEDGERGGGVQLLSAGLVRKKAKVK